MRKPSSTLLMSLLFLWALNPFATVYAASDDPIYTSFFSNVAVSGYDTVAYFTEGEPVEGSRMFSTSYQGATWHFKNAENLATFNADPEAYSPQYGGYCAYAMAQGDTVSAQPDLWTIHDGKLYLNYSRSVNKTWLAGMEAFIVKADAIWPELLKGN